MEYLFIDLRTPERRTHASDCYSACHTRAVALLAWIDQVNFFKESVSSNINHRMLISDD